MNLSPFTGSILTRLQTDTGSGGLLEPGAELVKSIRWGQRPPAEQGSIYPYLTLNMVLNVEADSGFTSDGRVLAFDAIVWGSAESPDSMNDVQVGSARVFDRLQRWEGFTAPTGWSAAGPLVLTNSPDLSDLPRVYAQGQTFEVQVFRSV